MANYFTLNFHLPVSEPTEKVGISCDFNDDCACGYQYISANINERWFIASELVEVYPEPEVPEPSEVTTSGPEITTDGFTDETEVPKLFSYNSNLLHGWLDKTRKSSCVNARDIPPAV